MSIMGERKCLTVQNTGGEERLFGEYTVDDGKPKKIKGTKKFQVLDQTVNQSVNPNSSMEVPPGDSNLLKKVRRPKI